MKEGGLVVYYTQDQSLLLDLFELDLFLKWNYFTQIYLKLIKYNLDSGRGTAKVAAKHTWIRFSTLNLLPNTGGVIWGGHIKDS